MPPEEGDSICDRCAAVIDLEETNPGPKGTEWEDASLCNDCCAEVTPVGGD